MESSVTSKQIFRRYAMNVKHHTMWLDKKVSDGCISGICYATAIRCVGRIASRLPYRKCHEEDLAIFRAIFDLDERRIRITPNYYNTQMGTTVFLQFVTDFDYQVGSLAKLLAQVPKTSIRMTTPYSIMKDVTSMIVMASYAYARKMGKTKEMEDLLFRMDSALTEDPKTEKDVQAAINKCSEVIKEAQHRLSENRKFSKDAYVIELFTYLNDSADEINKQFGKTFEDLIAH